MPGQEIEQGVRIPLAGEARQLGGSDAVLRQQLAESLAASRCQVGFGARSGCERAPSPAAPDAGARLFGLVIDVSRIGLPRRIEGTQA